MAAPSRVCPRPDRTIVHPASRRFFAAPCNRWGCKRCGSRKRDKLARRAAALRPDGMLTTTISDACSGGIDATSLEAVAYMQQRERVFRRHIKRVLGGFAYLWVVELGELGGRVHRHYLVRWNRRALVAGWRRGWLPKYVLEKLQKFARDAGLGRVDWQPITDDRVASLYVAKYVTKTADALQPVIKAGGRASFRRFASNEHYDEPRETGWVSLNVSVQTAVRLFMPATTFEGGPYWLLPDWALPSRPGP